MIFFTSIHRSKPRWYILHNFVATNLKAERHECPGQRMGPQLFRCLWTCKLRGRRQRRSLTILWIHCPELQQLQTQLKTSPSCNSCRRIFTSIIHDVWEIIYYILSHWGPNITHGSAASRMEARHHARRRGITHGSAVYACTKADLFAWCGWTSLACIALPTNMYYIFTLSIIYYTLHNIYKLLRAATAADAFTLEHTCQKYFTLNILYIIHNY